MDARKKNDFSVLDRKYPFLCKLGPKIGPKNQIVSSS